LQGVEGFGITTPPHNTARIELAENGVSQVCMAQEDVDFALNWNAAAEPQETDDANVDNWLSETDIEQTLLPVSSSVELLHKPADIITLPVALDRDEAQLADLYIETKPSYFEPHQSDSLENGSDVSKLDALDQKSVDEKLALFT
jgi:hypothetical protein